MFFLPSLTAHKWPIRTSALGNDLVEWPWVLKGSCIELKPFCSIQWPFNRVGFTSPAEGALTPLPRIDWRFGEEEENEVSKNCSLLYTENWEWSRVFHRELGWGRVFQKKEQKERHYQINMKLSSPLCLFLSSNSLSFEIYILRKNCFHFFLILLYVLLVFPTCVLFYVSLIT